MLLTHAIKSLRTRPGRRLRPMLALVLAGGLALAGCSGGGDAMTQPIVPAPAADLDTAKAPPRTVSSMPLLPPVPEDPAKQPPAGSIAEAPPLEYDHLYSDDEQLQIKSDLAAAAAKVQRN